MQEPRPSDQVELYRARQATQNAFVESVSGRLRDELLNETLFISSAHTQFSLAAWKKD